LVAKISGHINSRQQYVISGELYVIVSVVISIFRTGMMIMVMMIMMMMMMMLIIIIIIIIIIT